MLRSEADVLHLHEWQCSAAAMLYWDVYYPKGALSRPRLVLTIHNMDNSGECRQDEFATTGVPGKRGILSADCHCTKLSFCSFA